MPTLAAVTENEHDGADEAARNEACYGRRRRILAPGAAVHFAWQRETRATDIDRGRELLCSRAL